VTLASLKVRLAKAQELSVARERLKAEWGDPQLVRDTSYFLNECSCLIAGDFAGVAAYSLRDRPIAELVSINAFHRHSGVGTALLNYLVELLRPEYEQLRLATTNDNLDALRFYQRRGFRLSALRLGAVDRARIKKASIPVEGDFGIPLHDEIDLVLPLGSSPA